MLLPFQLMTWVVSWTWVCLGLIPPKTLEGKFIDLRVFFFFLHFFFFFPMNKQSECLRGNRNRCRWSTWTFWLGQPSEHNWQLVSRNPKPYLSVSLRMFELLVESEPAVLDDGSLHEVVRQPLASQRTSSLSNSLWKGNEVDERVKIQA